MDNARKIVTAWENEEIHFAVPEFWTRATGKTNPIAMAKIMIASRGWMWPVVIIIILAFFANVGWPFDSEGIWIKAGLITAVFAYLILNMFALPFMGYTALDDFIVTLENDKNSDEAQKSLRETTRTKDAYELRRSRPNWRIGKERIRRRVHRRRRLMRKTSS